MSYDLQSLKAPRLTGLPLRLFTTVMENDFLNWVLLPKLFTDAGIVNFRKTKVDEAPTLHPLDHGSAGSKKGKKKKSTNLEGPLFDTSEPLEESLFTTIDHYVKHYQSKKGTPLDVVKTLLEKMKEADAQSPPLKAFIKINEEDIIRQAEQSTELLKQKKPRSILEGVPIPIKDELDVKGYPTSVGTAFLGSHDAEEDATVVARLREAGAIIFGKTNMHEIGIGVTGFNPHYGAARNPYKLDHYTGGSSSGSAAAVAANAFPAAIGADGGGSIRIPASFCGMVGLKATFGRISEFGAADLCWSVAHIGPIASTVRDAARLYQIIAGVDQNDHHSELQPLQKPIDLEALEPKKKTLGIYKPWFDDVDSDVKMHTERALITLESMGFSVKEIDIPDLELFRVAHIITIASEMATAMEPHYKKYQQVFGNDVRINLVLGRHLTNRDYIHAQRARTRALNIMRQIFSDVDCVVTPSTGCVAPQIRADVLSDGESDLQVLSKIMRFAPLANLTGHPAISFPVGYTSENLPVGLQVMANHWQEEFLLQIAWLFEKKLHRKGPQLHINAF